MPRTGRPRGFDRSEAVRKAMHAFWENGYEATSMSDLQEALGGLSTASIYAAFGSKGQLFAEALALYMATCGAIVQPLEDSTLDPREALHRTLRLAVEVQTGEGHPSGCMAVLAGTNLISENDPIRRLVAAARETSRESIAACIDRAVAERRLRKDVDRKALTLVFDTFLKGVSVEIRDGIPATTLLDSADAMMAVWDLYAPRPARATT